MGKRIAKYYDFVKEKGGLPLQMKLALKTGILNINAESSPDDPVVLDRIHQVIKDLLNDPSVPRF